MYASIGIYSVTGHDHGVLEPVRRAHQVLHPAIDQALVRLRECALLVLLHSVLPTTQSVLVFCLLPGEVRIVLLWGGVLVRGPVRHATPCEQLEGELLEEVLDDVHHIRADVPDDVEQVQEGQRAGGVDPGVMFGGACGGPLPVVLGQSLGDSLVVCARWWWI